MYVYLDYLMILLSNDLTKTSYLMHNKGEDVNGFLNNVKENCNNSARRLPSII